MIDAAAGRLADLAERLHQALLAEALGADSNGQQCALRRAGRVDDAGDAALDRSGGLGRAQALGRCRRERRAELGELDAGRSRDRCDLPEASGELGDGCLALLDRGEQDIRGVGRRHALGLERVERRGEEVNHRDDVSRAGRSSLEADLEEVEHLGRLLPSTDGLVGCVGRGHRVNAEGHGQVAHALLQPSHGRLALVDQRADLAEAALELCEAVDRSDADAAERGDHDAGTQGD